MCADKNAFRMRRVKNRLYDSGPLMHDSCLKINNISFPLSSKSQKFKYIMLPVPYDQRCQIPFLRCQNIANLFAIPLSISLLSNSLKIAIWYDWCAFIIMQKKAVKSPKCRKMPLIDQNWELELLQTHNFRGVISSTEFCLHTKIGKNLLRHFEIDKRKY